MPYGPMLGKLVTVYGGSGFLGRYFIQRVLRTGATVRVAVRNSHSARHLYPMADPGQVAAVPTNLRHEASVARAAEGADVVVNLVGILFEKGSQRFDDVHVRGAERIAKAAKAGGAESLIQMSALGAGPDSPSRYARSKAAGEAAVREAFPEATVFRPSIVFGPEDNFFNYFAWMATIAPALPLIGGGQTRFQPVYVGDVADAMMAVLFDPDRQGQTYELGGPRVYTFEDLLRLILRLTGHTRPLIPLPWSLASVIAALSAPLPEPPLTQDQLRLLRQDNVLSGTAPGLEQLGLEATAVETIVPTYMDRYRKGGRFSAMRYAR